MGKKEVSGVQEAGSSFLQRLELFQSEHELLKMATSERLAPCEGLQGVTSTWIDRGVEKGDVYLALRARKEMGISLSSTAAE
jgi:hypothetical protein